MYYVKQVAISNMHNQKGCKVYDLNVPVPGDASKHGVTYFFGRNGSGKTTILNAIQLGLLGYIPGTNKRVSDIFAHASGSSMVIDLTLVDPERDEVIKVLRTWSDGKSIASSVTVTPEMDLEALVKNIELPIYNFDSFIGQTANSLKDWFIQFMPKFGGEVDWSSELHVAASGIRVPAEYISETAAAAIGDNAIDQCKALNNHIKAQKSAVNATISSLESTLKTLVVYDDVPSTVSELEVRTALDTLESEYRAAVDYAQIRAQVEQNAKIQQQIEDLQLPADSADADPEILDHREAISETEKYRHQLSSDIAMLDVESSELIIRREALRTEQKQCAEITAGGGECPYTHSYCKGVEAVLVKTSARSADIADAISAINKEIETKLQRREELSHEYDKQEQVVADHQVAIKSIEARYDRCNALRDMMIAIPDVVAPVHTLDELTEKRNELMEMLKKLSANATANTMRGKLVNDLADAKDKLEAIKVWEKRTGPNGLQDELARSTFESTASVIQTFLNDMDQSSIHNRKFTFASATDRSGSAKSNGFSFGMTDSVHGYVPYNLLSSGEKCLVTLALLSYIVVESYSPLFVILIDDAFDHLDPTNMATAFDFMFKMSKTYNIQYIVSGAQSTQHDDDDWVYLL